MQPQFDRAAWLKGSPASCDVPPPTQPHPHRLVLLGAPGVGKGTQAELLSLRLGTCHLSTGDVFRAARSLCEPSPALAVALDCLRRGDLVTDDTVLSLIAERAGCFRCGGGFLLDGFPRTVAQAEALEKLLARQGVELETVLSYDLPLERIVSRLSGRRTCSQCKAVFYVEARPPATAGICDHCGSALYHREDDRPEAVRVRLESYERSTAPLANFYQHRDLLVSIAAEGEPEEIFERSLAALQAARL